MQKVVLATGNAGKVRELASLLSDFGLDIVAQTDLGVDSAEETGLTFIENAILKARHAAQITGLPAIADDSGLCVDALGGAPGIRSARYCEGTDADRNAFLLKNMEDKEDRACRFVCAIACVLADGETVTVRGECEGELLHENHGAGGFGYDPLFYVPEYECTFGELAPEVKNRISHRARALGRLRDVLKDKI
mgnify:CR=1 FL=1